jgi:hypothetical protein
MGLRPSALLLLLLVAGCASAVPKPSAPAAAPVQIQTYSAVGLEGVIGRTARVIETQFGRPLLDVREGSARKLQYAAAACVLDAYLYPPKGGGEPIVTHVDARTPAGADFDRASCVAALQAERAR